MREVKVNIIVSRIKKSLLKPALIKCADRRPSHVHETVARSVYYHDNRTAAHNAAAPTAAPTRTAPACRPAPFLPGEPSAAQSRQAAYISTTNAWPSGLCSPCAPTLYGFTTGCSQPSDVKCTSAGVLVGAVAEERGAELVDVLEGEGEEDGFSEEREAEEGDVDGDEEEEEEGLEGAERAMRLCSARGRWVCTPARSARR